MCDCGPKGPLERRYGLCAPTDAISDDLSDAISTLHSLGVAHCELRTVEGVPFLELPIERRRQIGALLSREALQVALLDTDVGSAALGKPFAPQWEVFRAGLNAAKEVGASAVRVYSFSMAGASPDEGRDEVIARLARMAELAAQSGTMLLVENQPGTYAQTGVQLGELLVGVNSPALGAAFNPAGFVACKLHPFLIAFMAGPAKNYVRCLRIRDARLEDGQPVLPDQGNGDLRELISALAARSYDGFYSLDPGLDGGAETFCAAYRAFQAIVEALL